MYQKILLNIYIYSYAPVNQFTGTIAHSCVKNLILKNKFMVFTATQFGRASVSNYTVQEKPQVEYNLFPLCFWYQTVPSCSVSNAPLCLK